MCIRDSSYASSEDATSKMWWLDVENGTCHPGEWSDLKKGEWWSCDTTLNADTILGAVSALRRRGIKAGVYCTKLQWQQITGGYLVPGGMPLWIAGARWTSPPYPARYHYAAESANDAFCAGDYDFGGGVVRLLQETPGRNGYPFDPDYAC